MCPRPCTCHGDDVSSQQQSATARIRQRAEQIKALAPRYLPFLRRRPDPVRQVITTTTEEHLRLLHRTTQRMLPSGPEAQPLLNPTDIRAIVLERSSDRGSGA